MGDDLSFLLVNMLYMKWQSARILLQIAALKYPCVYGLVYVCRLRMLKKCQRVKCRYLKRNALAIYKVYRSSNLTLRCH